MSDSDKSLDSLALISLFIGVVKAWVEKVVVVEMRWRGGWRVALNRVNSVVVHSRSARHIVTIWRCDDSVIKCEERKEARQSVQICSHHLDMHHEPIHFYPPFLGNGRAGIFDSQKYISQAPPSTGRSRVC